MFCYCLNCYFIQAGGSKGKRKRSAKQIECSNKSEEKWRGRAIFLHIYALYFLCFLVGRGVRTYFWNIVVTFCSGKKLKFFFLFCLKFIIRTHVFCFRLNCEPVLLNKWKIHEWRNSLARVFLESKEELVVEEIYNSESCSEILCCVPSKKKLEEREKKTLPNLILNN